MEEYEYVMSHFNVAGADARKAWLMFSEVGYIVIYTYIQRILNFLYYSILCVFMFSLRIIQRKLISTHFANYPLIIIFQMTQLQLATL